MTALPLHGLLLALAACCVAGRFVDEASAQIERQGEFAPPLAIGNQSPVISAFGIPKARGTGLAAKGQTEWDASYELTSHFNQTIDEDENITLDGETSRVVMQLRYGLNENWNIGVEVPWMRHSAGFLDGFIIEWHDFFGFSQRGRDEVPEDRLLYRYRRNGVTLIDIQSPVEGIGDVVVSAQRLLGEGPGKRSLLHTQIKLPTGDADKLTGSGAADLAAGIEWSRRWRERWHSNFRAGLAYLGDGDLLPGLRRNLAAYAGIDIAWRPLRALSFRIQYDAHTAPYRDSELDELSLWSGMLTAGGTIYATRNAALDLAVVENVPNSFAVSDVSFYVRLRVALDGRP